MRRRRFRDDSLRRRSTFVSGWASITRCLLKDCDASGWRSADQTVGDEGANPRQRDHVGELRGGPLPRAGLAAHYGNGGHALQGEGEEHQERNGATQREIVLQRRL